MIVARSRSCEDASVKIQTAAKNIATGETSQVITSHHFSSLLFTSMSILTSLALIKGWGQIVKLKKSKKYFYDLGETLPSCSGIHPEVLDQATPKSHK